MIATKGSLTASESTPAMLAHITLATRNVRGTAEFFQQTLGWQPLRMPANIEIEAQWLEMGGGQHVHILGVPDFAPSAFEREYGRHIAVFYAGSQFDGLKRRLAERGAELIPPIRPTPFERFFFRDPNGYMFEVIDSEAYRPE